MTVDDGARWSAVTSSRGCELRQVRDSTSDCSRLVNSGGDSQPCCSYARDTTAARGDFVQRGPRLSESQLTTSALSLPFSISDSEMSSGLESGLGSGLGSGSEIGSASGMSGSAVQQGAAGAVRRPCSGSVRRPYSSLLLLPVLLLLLAASPTPPVLAVDMNSAQALALIEMRVALGVTGMQWWRTNGKVVCGAWIGVECDTRGNVVSVTAYNVITVPGLLPSSFTKLKTLTYLDLSSNRLNASLDQFARPLLHLPNLRVLTLNNNKLWGSVPSYLLQKPKLQKLLLSRNFLTGTLPPKKSKTLGTLSIAHNFIRGRFPFTMSCNTVGNCLDNPGARCTSYPQRTPSRCLAQCGGAEVGATAGTAATAATAAATTTTSRTAAATASASNTAAAAATAALPPRDPAALIATAATNAAAAAASAATAAARPIPRTAASVSPTALKTANTTTAAASSSSFSNPSSVYSAAPFLTPCGGYGRCLPSVDDSPGDVSASLLPATQWTCMCAAGATLKDNDVCECEKKSSCVDHRCPTMSSCKPHLSCLGYKCECHWPLVPVTSSSGTVVKCRPKWPWEKTR